MAKFEVTKCHNHVVYPAGKLSIQYGSFILVRVVEFGLIISLVLLSSLAHECSLKTTKCALFIAHEK